MRSDMMTKQKRPYAGESQEVLDELNHRKGHILNEMRDIKEWELNEYLLLEREFNDVINRIERAKGLLKTTLRMDV
jgi:hypothetical protein